MQYKAITIAAICAAALSGQIVTPVPITTLNPVSTVKDCTTGVTVAVPTKPQDASFVLGKNVSVKPIQATGWVPDMQKLVSDGNALWGLSGSPSTLFKLDRNLQPVDKASPTSASITAFAIDSDDITWLGLSDGSVVKYNRVTRQVIQKIVPPGGPTGVAVADLAFVGPYLAVLRRFPLRVSTTESPAVVYSSYNSTLYYWAGCTSTDCNNVLAGDVSFVQRTDGKVLGTVGVYRVRITTTTFAQYGDVVSINPDSASSILVTQAAGTIYRFSLVNGAIVPRLVTDTLSTSDVSSASYVDGTLWMLSGKTGALIRYDVARNQLIGVTPVLAGATSMFHDGRRVWVTSKDRIERFNAFDGNKIDEIAPNVNATAIASDGVNVFVSDKNTNTIKVY